MLKKLKGVIIVAIISLASVMMPFNIYADTQIVPTYSSSAQSWVSTNGQVNVTNYCEGTTASTSSCKLTFTVSSNWYGMIYFDGYDSSNTMWINYQPVFIADGVGEYNYNFWQSSQKVITKVNINIINLVKPDSTVDLSQIIQLLTAIHNDTSAIDLTLDNTLSQITNVLNQLIVSNGYLELMSKYRQWDIPFESFSFVNMFFNKGLQPNYLATYNYFNFPIFSCTSNDKIFLYWSSNLNYDLVLGVSENLYNIDQVKRYLQFDNSNIDITGYQRVGQFNYGSNQRICWILKLTVINKGSEGQFNMWFNNVDVMPIYFNRSDYRYISNDFALQFGLSNYYLDAVLKLANGTTQSNQANNDLNTASSEFTSQSDDVIGVEENITNNFESQVQNIDINTGLSGFGGNFMTSATWVRTQFDRLTENNPYGSLVAYGLTLGFALLMLGKVLL